MTASSAQLYIGTSGWHYPHWQQSFYAGTRSKQWLEYYSRRFNAVEVNASFYRHLSVQTLQQWLACTPPTFRFSIKGHRHITHHKRLHDVADAIRRERDTYQILHDKLVAVVWQCPANLSLQLDALTGFCQALAAWPEVRHSIEFRHASWFCADVADCLHHYRVAVCQSDAADWPLWPSTTTDLVYVRLHGHSRTYASCYSRQTLMEWSRQISHWLTDGLTVHVYFDNDAEAAAPRNAQLLRELIGNDSTGRS